MDTPIIFETIRQTALSPMNLILPGILLLVALGTLGMKKYKIAIGAFLAAVGIGALSYFGLTEAQNLAPIAVYQDHIEIGSDPIAYDDIVSHTVLVVVTSPDPSKGGVEDKTLILAIGNGEKVEIDGLDYDVEKIDAELASVMGR